MPGSAGTLLAIGGYTPGNAPARDGLPGLTTWWWDGGTALRAAGSADLPSPSFACWHPTLPVLYAVSELDQGLLTALAVAEDGGLRQLASVGTGGAQPCWVTTDPSGRSLLIANYGSGSAAAFALDEQGRPAGAPTVVAHHGSGPVAGRQDGPHVHQLMPTADGFVLATDLGTDRIAEYRVRAGVATAADGAGGADAAGVEVTEVGSITMPAGSGPRHIALAADGRTGFVTGELDGTVTIIRRDAGVDAAAQGPEGTAVGAEPSDRWTAAGQVPCSGRPGAQPSQLQLTGGDRWLLVANRGPDTLAVLDVTDGLRVHQELPTGRTPRYFTVHGDQVLVACQDADLVQAFTVDEARGTLTPLGALAPGSAPLRTPSCVAPRR